ncbi:hypothetical protein EON64_20105 [archaeon]|nr:MAG: hypothetical protein EON64_20105 [archaeon]
MLDNQANPSATKGNAYAPRVGVPSLAVREAMHCSQVSRHTTSRHFFFGLGRSIHTLLAVRVCFPDRRRSADYNWVDYKHETLAFIWDPMLTIYSRQWSAYRTTSCRCLRRLPLPRQDNKGCSPASVCSFIYFFGVLAEWDEEPKSQGDPELCGLHLLS